MLLQPSDDQEFLRETTERFLDDKVPADALRELRDDPVGFDRDYWRQGAELGWTSLLVDESAGGGSVSEHGLVDLSLLAYEFGRAAAPGPLIAANVVAGALSASGSHGDLVAGLLDGSAIATWAHTEPAPHQTLGDVTLEIAVDGESIVVSGSKRPVESAGAASHLLVTGRTGDGLSQVVVPTDADGVSITALKGVDLTRRFDAVHFDQVRLPADAVVGELGGAGPDVERQLLHALVLLSAETVGAMQTGFDMTVEWAFDRYSFGRPLASYQALKHRFADMASWLHASHAITDEAAAAVAAGDAKAARLACAAKAYTGDHGTALLQDCVQMHGGIGVTFEHDIHFFLRRATADRAVLGPPAEHRRRLATLVADLEETA